MSWIWLPLSKFYVLFVGDFFSSFLLPFSLTFFFLLFFLNFFPFFSFLFLFYLFLPFFPSLIDLLSYWILFPELIFLKKGKVILYSPAINLNRNNDIYYFLVNISKIYLIWRKKRNVGIISRSRKKSPNQSGKMWSCLHQGGIRKITQKQELLEVFKFPIEIFWNFK